jgi:Domain of unknown function (DUF4345)
MTLQVSVVRYCNQKASSMKTKSFSNMQCSIARTLEHVGSRWSLLIIRDAMMGVIVAARRRDALIFLAIFMAGAALGRIVSIIMAGMPPAAIMPLLYYELIMLAIAVVLARRASTPN